MKNLKDYLIFNQNTKGNIKEGLLSRKVSIKTPIRYKPKDRDELMDIIIDLLEKGQTNLNCIDVSGIDDMGGLFYAVTLNNIIVRDIDISEWDVSNVTNMNYMFKECKYFNSDLSKWNVNRVTNMQAMFEDCESFNSDISNWDVSNVTKMYVMFCGCKKFNTDLSNWKIYTKNTVNMFKGCTTLKKNNNMPSWYKE